MAWSLTAACVLIAFASLVGGALPLFGGVTHTRMQLFLSFASGAMVGAVFFHMLPEAVADGGPSTLQWSCAGLIAVFFLERFFSFHQHEAPDVVEPDHGHAHPHAHPTPTRKRSELHWGVAAVGLAVHTVVGGFALASAFAADRRGHLWGTASGVLLATALHKPADALTITSLMVRSGSARWATVMVNLAYSALVPLGVAGFFLTRGWFAREAPARFTATALAFSAGTFLCIALSDLLPELQFHKHDRVALSVSLLAGLGLMAVSASIG
jgi:zinc and cadmium transporter